MCSIQRSSKHSRDGETKVQTGFIEVRTVDCALTLGQEGKEISELINLPIDVVKPVITSLARSHTSQKHFVNVGNELFSCTVRKGDSVRVSLVN